MDHSNKQLSCFVCLLSELKASCAQEVMQSEVISSDRKQWISLCCRVVKANEQQNLLQEKKDKVNDVSDWLNHLKLYYLLGL